MTSWHADTPPWYRDTAETACTAKQLEVLKLASHNLTDAQIGQHLGITRQAANQRRVGATTAIYTELSVSGEIERALRRNRKDSAA